MSSSGVRVVISLGRPDPDRLSTAVLGSLMAHLGLLAGVMVFQLLPSEAVKLGEPHFVTLAAGSPPAGGGGGRAEPTPLKPRPAPPTPKAESQPPEPAPSPAPTKTSVPSEKQPPKPNPPPRAHETAPAPQSEPHDEPSPEEPAGEPGGDPGGGKPGAAPGPAGGAPGEAGGVGGTSFGEGDFRFAWYQTAIESKLRAAWREPRSTDTMVQTATVSFIILRNGSVKDVQVVAPSGNAALDLSTMRAVYDATPLPPLPRGWSGDSVHVSIEFSLKPLSQ